MNYSDKKNVEFNSKLPITIEVLEKIFFDEYILKIGTKKIKSKSAKKLESKKKYWTELSRSKSGSIIITNLIKQPEFLINLEYFFEIENLKDLKKLLNRDYKRIILKLLADSKSKSEFLFFTNILLALKEEIYTIPIKDINSSRYLFLQYKFINMDIVKFYVVLKNLAPISGELNLKDLTLKINCSYENSLNILKKRVLELKESFSKIEFNLNSDIEPLYDFKKSLLDLKV